MSVDNAIRALAFSEARTLGEGMALVARHRNELVLALHAAAPRPGAVEKALEKLEAAAHPIASALDRTA